MDMSKLSDADLDALSSGDMTKMSNEGLAFLSGEPIANKPSIENKLNNANLELTRAEKIALELDNLLNVTDTAVRLTPFGRYLPTRQDASDFGVGASQSYRGGLNLINEGLGDKVYPKSVSSGSGYETLGNFADPVALAVGGVASKLVPIGNVLGQGVKKGTIELAKRAGVGATVGGVTGGLSDDGDIETGATFGAIGGIAFPVLLQGIAKGSGLAIDIAKKRITEIKAGKVLRAVADKELPLLQAALSQADDSLTASQAAERVGSTKFSALGDLARSQKSQLFKPKIDAQDAQNIADIQSLSGGATQTEAKNIIKSSQTTLGNIAIPIRDKALSNANSGRYNPFSEKPAVDIDGIVGRIHEKLNDVELTGNETAKKILISVARDLKSATEQGGGVVDAFALDAIRKNSVNSAVDTLLGAADPKAKASAAAAATMTLKPLFTKAIVDAGGHEYPAYLKTYEQGMKVINQKKLGAKALEMLNNDPQTFINLVEGNNPKLVQKLFTTDYDVKSAMGQKFLKMQSVADKLTRDQNLSKMAREGASELENVLNDTASKFRLPGMISAKITIANKGLDVVEGRLNKKVMAKVYNAMINGKDANDLMNTLSTEEQSRVLQALKTGKLSPYLNAVSAGNLQP